MKRAATFITLLIAALIFPVMVGGAGQSHDGAPPHLLEWPMLPGESISQIARLIYPDDVAMQRRFIDAAVRENPATFSQINVSQKFDQETLIWLPDLKELSKLASSATSPRHYLRPALPAMQPGATGAQPSRLQMSATIGDSREAGLESRSPPGGLALARAPAIRHLNATPAYDRGAVAVIEALVARNLSLKEEQQQLNARIAALEAGITQALEALARVHKPKPRAIKRVVTPAPAPEDSSMAPDFLLSPSPLHLLTATGILFVGGGWMWLRRRRSKGELAVIAPVPLQGGGVQEQALDLGAPTTTVYVEEDVNDDDFISVDEIASIVEEAKIFVALGRTDHAIEVLEDYITTHPRASAHPWLYLMEIYRNTQRREDFEAVAKRFHQAMNVITPQWEKSGQTLMVVPHSLEEFPHLLVRLSDGWGRPESLDFLNNLLQDNRGGERQGFSMDVLQEILLLLAILEMRDHLPPLQPF